MKKKRIIEFISIIMIIIVLIIFLKDCGSFNRKVVVDDSVKDTIYTEEIKRDSIKNEIDSVILSIDKNDKYEKEFYKAVADTDSIAIVRKFIQLCTE